MSKKKNSFSAKGYYIALVLCAAAIGVSGYLYYRNADEKAADVPAAVTRQMEQEASSEGKRPQRGAACGAGGGHRSHNSRQTPENGGSPRGGTGGTLFYGMPEL